MDIMCEIMEKLATEARDEGKAEGIAEGIATGKAAGTLEILNNLVQDGILTITEAAKRANMTEVIFTEKTQQFKA
jgi:flagellar biosynthesis/type III secretory pathway protein FliH